MKDRYDFSGAARGPVVPPTPEQTAVILRLDTGVIDWFRQRSNESGGGDALASINGAMVEYVQQQAEGGLEETLRRVIREELRVFAQRSRAAYLA
ncbi:MAG: CopG family transcriptional regulator [Sphingobacteriia bacterium]|nr:CopG family transcriptional regulator [Sphingobacteriia bacterium]NCC39908.1 CopG family transcriptional regulator [Gammaproteobacteria bacterium]